MHRCFRKENVRDAWNIAIRAIAGGSYNTYELE